MSETDPTSRLQPPRAPSTLTPVAVVLALLVGLIALAGGVEHLGRDRDGGAGPAAAPAAQPAGDRRRPTATRPYRLPGGGTQIFGSDRFLVAYYGTAGTGALGVLGEDPPAVMHRRLERAARPFAGRGRPVVPVYELIVTVADRHPGRRKVHNHDIARWRVEQYVQAARAHGALLLLDLQTGQDDFLTAARRWAWALREPHVGLAIDPEWRMPAGVAPGTRIGSVGAAEVNRTSAWLSTLVRREHLPQKLFVIHQFRTAMVRGIAQVRQRPGLAMVQHVDGFGTRRDKLATYRAVARPRQFAMGFKLFYDEDVRRMGASTVRAIRPRVRFVSFQ